MKGVSKETDFVVIGSGVAALRAAIELAAAARVLIVTKKEIPTFKVTDLKSEALWLSDEDEVSLHPQDTIQAGDGLCNPAAVKVLVEEGPERIEEVIAWGGPQGSPLRFELENPHTKVRVLHSQGVSTTREVLRLLWEKVLSHKNISIAQTSFATALQVESGQITGVTVLDDKGTPHDISCSGVLLATGGLGQIYRNTTNPQTATADGLAMAFRAGAEVSDLEFVQFHPTSLYMKKVPPILLEEGLRAEGAFLRNFELDRFMGKYHPLAERAPGDLVSRAIVHEMEVSRAKEAFVYLDLTHMNATKVQKRFPRVYQTCMAYNVDITEDVVPVRPAAHFSVGGVRTDLNGKTNIAGLYAAGEVASTGVHGASRLPSNSLLEALVYGTRTGKAMRDTELVSQTAVPDARAAYANGPVDAGTETIIGQIQDLMWKQVGLVRTRVDIQKAVLTLEAMAPNVAHPKNRRGYEASNMHLAALLVARSALAREESRGTHYRIDNPAHDDKKFLKHSVIRGDKVAFV
ncbi:MAG TPA: FAD-binding protein [Candidatus Sulfotelmatobacter sp.]|nr:FAD-binding protein [Candidatus Sulfotelmatobacter sp.]